MFGRDSLAELSLGLSSYKAQQLEGDKNDGLTNKQFCA